MISRRSGDEQDVISLAEDLGSQGTWTDVTNIPSPSYKIRGYKATDNHQKINLLIDNLVSIEDEAGHILLIMPNERIVDTER